MTDLERVPWYSCPSCKGELRLGEYDKCDVIIDGSESRLPVYTCKECGGKYMIETMVRKSKLPQDEREAAEASSDSSTVGMVKSK